MRLSVGLGLRLLVRWVTRWQHEVRVFTMPIMCVGS